MVSVASRWRLAVAAVAMAATAACAEPQLQPWAGKGTPPLVRADLAGRTIDLKDFRGRVVLVNFWATWCDPCREEMPSFERLRAKLRGKPFEILAVNYGESSAKVSEFVRKEGLTLPVLLDPDKDAAGDWSAKGLPITFLVDARGQVRYWVFGERDWSGADSVRDVEKLIAEVPGAGH
jgi:thiol-disulfide isomerase/thioredoxin